MAREFRQKVSSCSNQNRRTTQYRNRTPKRRPIFYSFDNSFSFARNFALSTPPVQKSSLFKMMPGDAIIMCFPASSCPSGSRMLIFFTFTFGHSPSMVCHHFSNSAQLWQPGDESSSKIISFIYSHNNTKSALGALFHVNKHFSLKYPSATCNNFVCTASRRACLL